MRIVNSIVVFWALACAGLLQAAELSEPAPDFTLVSNNEEQLSMTNQLGNVVLINFWASWCGPCRQEMPALEDIYQQYSNQGFVLIAISVDEDSLAADRFMSGLSVTFPYFYDNDGKVSELYAVEAMPTTIIIDRQGQQRFLHKGYRPGVELKYLQEIKLLLAE